MCGILGILRLDGGTVDFGDLAMMAEIQHHRGPDAAAGVLLDGGRLGLGHVRLSIIDPALGAQPMADVPGELWISFNGEAYDHRPLRERLQRDGIAFATDSDTEVILGLYRRYGLDFVEHLNGEFAFAIWDSRVRRLVLVRDRLGIKPLFLHRSGRELLFASEAKALLTLPRMPRAFAPEFIGSAMLSVFARGVAPFAGLEQLPPAHVMVIEADGTITTREYWRQTYGDPIADARDAEAGLRDVFERTVRRRLVSDVPLCSYLSGGVDSTLVCGTMSRLANRDVTAFNIGFTDSPYDESADARAIAEHHGVRFETLHCPIERLAEHVEDCIFHTEMYLANPSAVGKYLLSRHVRDRGFKVALTGEGADEVFAGYPYFKLEALWRRELAGLPTADLTKRFREIEWRSEGILWNRGGYWRDTPRFFPFPSYHHLRALDFSRRRDTMLEVERNALGPEHTPIAFFERDFAHLRDVAWDPTQVSLVLARAQLAGYVLPTLGDRVEMAHSIEGRTPFMDVELLDYSGRLPASSLMDLERLREKAILHAAFRDLLPEPVRKAHKHPFFAPSFRLLGATPHGRALVAEHLSREALERVGVFRPAFIRRMALLWRFLPPGTALAKKVELVMSVALGVSIMHRQFIAQRPVARGAAGFAFRRVEA